MSKANVIGFKPSKDDREKLQQLLDHFQSLNPVGTVTNSDILRAAITCLYEKEGIKPYESKTKH